MQALTRRSRLDILIRMRGTGAIGRVQGCADGDWIKAAEEAYNDALVFPGSPARFLLADDYKGGRDFGRGHPFGLHTCVFARYDAESNTYLKDSPVDIFVGWTKPSE